MNSWNEVYQWGGVILGVIVCIALVFAIASSKKKKDGW